MPLTDARHGSEREAGRTEGRPISNTEPTPRHSATVLKPSHRYRLVASGTVSDSAA